MNKNDRCPLFDEKYDFFSEPKKIKTTKRAPASGKANTDTLFCHIEETLEKLEEPSLFAELTQSETTETPFPDKALEKSSDLENKSDEKVRRRRQIDPTTCERDYSLDEIEFMSALDEYKRTSGRMFPTCSEILEVIRSLGYVKGPTVSEMPEERPAQPTPLTSGTPALLNENAGENEEIVTILWNHEDRAAAEPISTQMGEEDDFEYREPLLIF